MWTIPVTIALILIVYILAIRCRSNHPGLAEIKKFSYAHRGLHGNGIPENSLAAFRLAKEKGYGIELDIHLMKDGELAVIHDSALKRTTGAEGRIEDISAKDIENYRLEGTEEKIPLLREVLELFDGAAPMVVELKPVDGNHAALAQKTCQLLDEYNGAFCIESFDPRTIIWLKKNRPDIIRGQLATNFFKSKEKLSFVVKFMLTHNLFNFLSVPDFVAYQFSRRHDTISNMLCRKIWGVQCVGWTIKDKDTHETALKEGWLSIFEKFEA